MKPFAISCACFFVFFTLLANAQDTGSATEESLNNVDTQRPYSPYAGGAVPNQVFWGDTHLHTSFSMDAGAFGNRLGLEEAYQFARGEEVRSSSGGRVKLARPLDFLVIADHSDNMGFFPDLFAATPKIMSDPKGKEWYNPN